MTTFDYWVPVNVLFGPGRLAELGEVVRGFGDRALVVTGAYSMRRHGVLDRALDLLGAAGVKAEVFDRVEPNPRAGTVDAAAEVARAGGCRVVIGLGGGSAMDAAKGVAAAAVNPGGVWRYVDTGDGDPRPLAGALPIVLVSTTAGAGTELTAAAALVNPTTREKAILRGPMLFAKVALVDPELGRTAPPRVTAASGVDVFFHALESWMSRRAQPMTRLVAAEAIRLTARYLPRAYREGGDLEARAQMAWANLLAGLAINTSRGSVLLHSLSHPLGAHHDVPHGEALAAVARPFLEAAQEAVPEIPDEVACLLAAGYPEAVPPPGRGGAAESVEAFLRSLGLPTRLRDLGVSEVEVAPYAEESFKTMPRGFAANPWPVGVPEARAIYLAAL